MNKESKETKRKTLLEMFKEIESLEVGDTPLMTVEDCLPFMCEKVEQALQRLDKYEEILSEGRLIQDEIYEEYNTDGENCYGVKRIRNNATIKLGKLEDIYEKGK